MSNLPLPGFHFDLDVPSVAAPIAKDRETFDKKPEAKCEDELDTDRPGPPECECEFFSQYNQKWVDCDKCRDRRVNAVRTQAR